LMVCQALLVLEALQAPLEREELEEAGVLKELEDHQAHQALMGLLADRDFLGEQETQESQANLEDQEELTLRMTSERSVLLFLETDCQN